MMKNDDKQAGYPLVGFRLQGCEYCIAAQYVSILKMPSAIYPLPDGKPHCIGAMRFEEQVLSVFDLRILLGMDTLREELENFADMKDKHLQWVAELERSAMRGTDFTLPVDPHQCSFGQWYDQYRTDNPSIHFVLRKIERPHANLHRCAAEVRALQKNGAEQETVMRWLETAKRICSAEILPLLDHLIKTYESANQGVVIVIDRNGKKFGLLVDEITSLVTFQASEFRNECIGINKINMNRPLIKNIFSRASEKIFYEIDPFQIMLLSR